MRGIKKKKMTTAEGLKKLERMEDQKRLTTEMEDLRRKKQMLWSELATDWEGQLRGIEELENKKGLLQRWRMKALKEKKEDFDSAFTDDDKAELEKLTTELQHQNKTLEELKQKAIDRTTLVYFISGSKTSDETTKPSERPLYDSTWQTYGAYSLCGRNLQSR